MRTLYLLTIIYISFALTNCASTDSPPKDINKPIQPAQTLNKKNPLKVTFYTKGQPNIPYKVIGEESISKFNQGGNKRQEATIRDGMRELAAAMGGDAVINIKHDNKSITGTVVAFQQNETIDASKG